MRSPITNCVAAAVVALFFTPACGPRGEAETADSTAVLSETTAVPLESRPDSVQSAGGKLYPVDDAARDPSFFAYRLHLAEAVAERNEAFLLDQIPEDATLSFGGAAGKADFVRMWNPADSNSEVWGILGRVLAGGGVLRLESEETLFQAPYYYAAFPGDQFDAFEHGVVLGENVPMREQPDSAAAVVRTLSFDIVRVPGFSPVNGSWVSVELGGRSGFIPARLVGFPVGYRAVFRKRGGRWQLSALVAGD